MNRSESKIICSCGGGARTPHDIGINGCARYRVTKTNELPTKFRIDERGFLVCDVGNNTITDYTLRQQRGYSEHKCGNWSCPKSKDSINSLTGDW